MRRWRRRSVLRRPPQKEVSQWSRSRLPAFDSRSWHPEAAERFYDNETLRRKEPKERRRSQSLWSTGEEMIGWFVHKNPHAALRILSTIQAANWFFLQRSHMMFLAVMVSSPPSFKATVTSSDAEILSAGIEMFSRLYFSKWISQVKPAKCCMALSWVQWAFRSPSNISPADSGICGSDWRSVCLYMIRNIYVYTEIYIYMYASIYIYTSICMYV